jgi:hypothetical protein
VAPLLTTPDRRRAPRRLPPQAGVADVAVLRPGVSVSVITISALGALTESLAPVRPGVRTELALEGIDGRRRLVNVWVLRCWVEAIDPLCYRSVVCFDDPLPVG